MPIIVLLGAIHGFMVVTTYLVEVQAETAAVR